MSAARNGDMSHIPTADLKAEIERRKRINADARVKMSDQYQKTVAIDPVGLWEVTTEGDCEGRTVNRLGTFEGHIVDIAFFLAKKSYYGLRFSPVDPKDREVIPDPEVKSVAISLSIDSGSWDLEGDHRAAAISEMLSKRPSDVRFTVRKGQYYATVILDRDEL